MHRVLLVVMLCAAGLPAQGAPPAPPATAKTQPSPTVTVRDAWARATAPGMSVGAVYLTLRGGAADDRLVAASTDRAGMTQIHVVTAADGMARMRETEAVEVPAGQEVRLAPQGTHIMLMDLSRPLVAGEQFRLRLKFAGAGMREIAVVVVAPGAEPPASR